MFTRRVGSEGTASSSTAAGPRSRLDPVDQPSPPACAPWSSAMPRRCRIVVQRANTSGSVRIGCRCSGRASGWSVSTVKGTGAGPHHAINVSRSSAIGSSRASRSNATAQDAANDCG